MAKELKPGVYSRLPDDEKRKFLDLRNQIADCESTIEQCDTLIAGHPDDAQPLRDVRRKADAKIVRLNAQIQIAAVRLNFEFGEPELPGMEAESADQT